MNTFMVPLAYMGNAVGKMILMSINNFNCSSAELYFIGMGDARLERAAFGSGDQRSIHLS